MMNNLFDFGSFWKYRSIPAKFGKFCKSPYFLHFLKAVVKFRQFFIKMNREDGKKTVVVALRSPERPGLRGAAAADRRAGGRGDGPPGNCEIL